MSPEQALGNATLTPASDVFSLGCVLYECITGRRAFFAHDATAVLAKILLDQPPAIEVLRPKTPPSLVRLVNRMLMKNASERPTDGNAAAEELAQVALDEAIPVVAQKRSIGETEQRVVCVVLAQDAANDTPTVLESDTSVIPGDSLRI